MPVRLDLALIKVRPELSRRKAREVIEKGQVTLDGRTVLEAGQLVEEGAQVAWDPNRKARPRVRASLVLLHEDEHLVVVDKPAGLLSVPTTPDAREDTALSRLQEYVARRRPRHPYVGVVHRLDRDTSGALAFALTPAVRAALRALFRAHRMERVYAALVEGTPPSDTGEVDLAIHDTYEGGRRRLARAGEPSHEARTRWRVIERLRVGALLEVRLETGRQHQIRLHLAHIGLHVLGDRVYGPDERRALLGAPRQMLHARRLAFTHPATGVLVAAESPLPEDFSDVLERMRKGSPDGPTDSRSSPPSRSRGGMAMRGSRRRRAR